MRADGGLRLPGRLIGDDLRPAVDELARAFEDLGLEPWGVVSAERYDAAAPTELSSSRLHPGTRSILVVASGGPKWFRRFLDDLGQDPRRLHDEPHPLDAFAERTFALLEPILARDGARFRRLSPAFAATPRVDFTKLGILAGLGLPSEIGILVHPRFGPWFAFRQAIFTTWALPESAPMARSLCEGCAAPCKGAPYPRGACVVAPEMRYDAIQIRYHASHEEGRREIAERLPGASRASQV